MEFAIQTKYPESYQRNSNLVVEIQNLATKIRNSVMEIRILVMETRNLVMESKTLIMEIRNLAMEIQNLIMEIRNLVMEIMESEIQSSRRSNPKSGHWKLDHRAWNPKPCSTNKFGVKQCKPKFIVILRLKLTSYWEV